MLDISNRSNCFYWQTDRNLDVRDYEKYFLKRQEVSNDDILSILQKGITSIVDIEKISIIDPDNEVKRGNVNIVRKVMVNGKPYIARMHPFGIKNGYFYVEKSALSMAGKQDLPVPQILEVHEARDKKDMDFVLMTASEGITMQTAVEKNSKQEIKLLYEAGSLMARLHKIKVKGFGSFDNQIAKKENKLVGLHNTYKEFIWCGLEENIQRLLSFKVIDNIQANKFLNIFKSHNFEPTDGPMLIHNDFADWNILVNKGKISGILDWDECHGGDPIADLACWSTFFDMTRFENFLRGYVSINTLPDDYDERFHFYRFRYTISKMALRVKRALVDDSDFIKDKIRVGKDALKEELDWIDKNY